MIVDGAATGTVRSAVSDHGPIPSGFHVWTHHWEYQDVYSRFDYVLVNKLAKADVDFDSSRILDLENWDQASDHRALLVVFE